MSYESTSSATAITRRGVQGGRSLVDDWPTVPFCGEWVSEWVLWRSVIAEHCIIYCTYRFVDIVWSFGHTLFELIGAVKKKASKYLRNRWCIVFCCGRLMIIGSPWLQSPQHSDRNQIRRSVFIFATLFWARSIGFAPYINWHLCGRAMQSISYPTHLLLSELNWKCIKYTC